MNSRKRFVLGILFGITVVTLLAFVPSLTDFNSGQFNTDNRTVTIGAAVPLTNASLRSSAAYQKDINSLAFSVSVYNTSTITNVEEWRSIPYPAGSPNVLGNVDLNGNLFMSGNGNFGSGAAAGTPSAIRLIDSTTGKYWQWSELGAQSNIIERLPTNGNNGLSWGIKMWTNAAVAADGTPTNQAMNFQLGTGLSVNWGARTISANAGGPTTSNNIPAGITWFGSTDPQTNILIDCSVGTVFRVVLTNNAALVLTNGTDGATYTLSIYQDTAGTRSISWKDNAGGTQTNYWHFGTDLPMAALTLTTNANSCDRIRLMYMVGVAGVPNTTNRVDVIGEIKGF